MFAACILFALPTIKETWVKADTHPVYNSRIYPLGMGGYRRAESYTTSTDSLKDMVVGECVRLRNELERIELLLAQETAKPEPSPIIMESLLKGRTRYRELLARYAEVIKVYPELEKRIEEERMKLKPKKD